MYFYIYIYVYFNNTVLIFLNIYTCRDIYIYIRIYM